MINLEPDKLYTVDDIAKLFGVGRRTVYNYMASGKLKGKKLGKRYYFTSQNIVKCFN